jgi:ribonuclease Z
MFSVRILGSSSATPAFSRFTSSQVVNFNDRYYLIDCGEGTQMQLQKFHIKYSRIDAMFISHLHGDHMLGAPGLLSSLSIYERTKPLPVYAPRGLKDILEMIFHHSDTVLRYEIEFHALEDFAPGEILFSSDRLEVISIPLKHRSFCRGFVFREKNKRRKFNFFKAKGLEVPKEYFHLLKQEKDVTLPDGRLIRANDLLMDREPPCSYAYCSDTMPDPEVIDYIRDVTLLYHEATFTHDMRDRAYETHHSTARDAGEAALKSGAKRLIIGHFSARYRELDALLDEALQVFPQTELALEGKVFDLREMNEAINNEE